MGGAWVNHLLQQSTATTRSSCVLLHHCSAHTGLFTSSNLGTQIHLSNLFPLILFSICYCSYLKKIVLIKRMCFALKEDFIRFPGYSISWLFHGKVSNINYFYLDLIRKQSPIKLTDDKKVFARKILWMIIDYIDC